MGIKGMTLQESLQIVASIKEIIQQKITHHYLMKYIETPIIDEDRIILLLSSMMDHKLSKNEVKKFITSAMLIQIALDTHEKVTNFGENLKKRQLMVLSGDYYSGLYYKILAEIDNIPLIKTLAEGIKTVNEYKIALYRIEDANIEEYMVNLKKAESTIVTKFCRFFDEKNICPLVEEILLLNRLLNEKKMAIQGDSSMLFDAFVKFLLPTKQISFQELSIDKKRSIFSACEDYITLSKNRIKEFMKEVKNPSLLLGQRIKLLAMERQTVTNLYLEEG
jgi:heptaprenyl diphosphate synthase